MRMHDLSLPLPQHYIHHPLSSISFQMKETFFSDVFLCQCGSTGEYLHTRIYVLHKHAINIISHATGAVSVNILHYALGFCLGAGIVGWCKGHWMDGCGYPSHLPRLSPSLGVYGRQQTTATGTSKADWRQQERGKALCLSYVISLEGRLFWISSSSLPHIFFLFSRRNAQPFVRLLFLSVRIWSPSSLNWGGVEEELVAWAAFFSFLVAADLDQIFDSLPYLQRGPLSFFYSSCICQCWQKKTTTDSNALLSPSCPPKKFEALSPPAFIKAGLLLFTIEDQTRNTTDIACSIGCRKKLSDDKDARHNFELAPVRVFGLRPNRH